MIKKILKLVSQHKFIAGIGLLIIIIGGYFSFQGLARDKNIVQYITTTVERGTLITSVSGSGQVSVSNQIDIKSKVSGDIVYLGVKKGEEVKSGALIAQVYASDAVKSVRDAGTNLETAKLELVELLQPPDSYSLLQAENTLIQAQDNLTKLKFTQESNYQDTLSAIQEAEDNLTKAYEDAFNVISNAFLDLPTVITGLDNILYSYEIADSQPAIPDTWNKSALLNSASAEVGQYINNAENDYKSARTAYNNSVKNYTGASRYSEEDVIESLLTETVETTKLIAEAVKSETNMLDFWVDYRSKRNYSIFSQVTQYQSNINSYTSKSNSHLSSLLAAQNSIENYKKSKVNAERDLEEMDLNQPFDLAAAERSVEEKQASLNNLKAGADGLDIRAKEIAIQQKEDALFAAQQNLADYYIRASFDGVIAELDFTKGDYVSSNSTIVSLITPQKIAEITLNEIDAAQVEVGQKVTLEFDAVSDLSITGQVVELDTLGTVAQGVVSYGVKIAFDVQDGRIKPGMSVSATIIIESKQDVLTVPISAVKTMGGNSYVEVLVNNQPQQQMVTVGLSSDTMIEIVEGLSGGEEIITQTVSNGSSGSNTGQTQNFGRNNEPSMGGMMMIR